MADITGSISWDFFEIICVVLIMCFHVSAESKYEVFHNQHGISRILETVAVSVMILVPVLSLIVFP